MRITVTQEDIDKGKRGSKCFCPVALALLRAQPTRCVSVGALTAAFDMPNKCVRLPTEVRFWINAFDLGQPVAPFEFDLPITKQNKVYPDQPCA